MQTRSKIIVVIIVIAIVAVAARNYLGRNREPDSVQIQDQLQAAALAASNKDAPEVMSVISGNYTDDANNNPERLDILLRRGMSNVQNLLVRSAPATITIKGDSAHTASNLSVKADGQVLFNEVVQLDWQKEKTRRYFIIPDETWRIVHSNYSGGMFGD